MKKPARHCESANDLWRTKQSRFENQIASSLSLLAMTLFNLILGLPAFAVDVEPQRIELTIPMDDLSEGTLQIHNPGKKAVQVRLSTGPYRSFEPGLIFPSAQNWIQFEMDTVMLAPKASIEVVYTISPPPNVEQDTAGEYLAAIVVDQLPTEPPETSEKSGASLTIIPRLAIPVYLKIKGRELINVEVEDVRIQEGSDSGDLLVVTTSLRNRGTIHVRPTGTVAVFENPGELHQAQPLGRSVPLLPQALLEIPTLLPLPSPGSYKAVVTIEVEPGNLLQQEKTFQVSPQGKIVSKS